MFLQFQPLLEVFCVWPHVGISILLVDCHREQQCSAAAARTGSIYFSHWPKACGLFLCPTFSPSRKPKIAIFFFHSLCDKYRSYSSLLVCVSQWNLEPEHPNPLKLQVLCPLSKPADNVRFGCFAICLTHTRYSSTQFKYNKKGGFHYQDSLSERRPWLISKPSWLQKS